LKDHVNQPSAHNINHRQKRIAQCRLKQNNLQNNLREQKIKHSKQIIITNKQSNSPACNEISIRKRKDIDINI
ncbi:hypothetical protein Q6248_28775, partial [Klebsiella pneumoniae]|uniref:hypothetical protein n=1 Tax=Klebsiella pneumoniae TaxID=573 RepID=UPI0027305972